VRIEGISETTDAELVTEVVAGDAAAFAHLAVPLRGVVICRYLLELSESETAVALRIPPGTVKSRLHRALTILRTEVADVVAD
jgi:DNA-directed RNA polymerase specialized sigma24 family protein